MKARIIKENIYLKADFISYLQSKDLAPATITHYVRELGLFLSWVDKEEIQITKPDVLRYLEYLKNKRRLQNNSRARVLNALNHYFTFVFKDDGVNPCALLKIRGTQSVTRRRIYSPDELTSVCDCYYHAFVREFNDSHIPKNQRQNAALSRKRNHVILSLLAHQGLSTKEVDNLKLKDLDVMSAKLHVKTRSLPLQATQIGVLMNYTNALRPKLLELHGQENERLFITLPSYRKTKTVNQSLTSVFKPLKAQLKTIDQHFVNLHQIRTSVITHWIKTYGLRKAQVMAGHKHIHNTERYLVNDMQDLINDINNLHPLR